MTAHLHTNRLADCDYQQGERGCVLTYVLSAGLSAGASLGSCRAVWHTAKCLVIEGGLLKFYHWKAA